MFRILLTICRLYVFTETSENEAHKGLWKDRADSLMKMLEAEKQEKNKLEGVNQKLTHVITR
jgi:Fe-S-cluster containining protein